MHAARSLTVVVCLVAPALPLTAQEPTGMSVEMRAVTPDLSTVGPIARAVMRESARRAAAEVPLSPNVAEIEAARAPAGRQRLGLWAALPGALVGGMIGGAAGQAAAEKSLAGAFMGMLAGAVVSVIAPRRVAAAFLGTGGGLVAGALVGAAIEGDCRSDDPCDRGAMVGAPVGAIAGGVLAHRMSRPKTEGVIYHAR
jgi:hypothetical protein